MLLLKKNKFKPLYKKFIKLRQNIQNRKKFLKFKKEKWQQFIQAYKNKLKRHKKFKPIDQTQHLSFKYTSKGMSYTKRYRTIMTDLKKFKLFYGGLAQKFVKKLIRQTLNKKYKKRNLSYIKLFESRLDTILYKSKFSTSMRNAKQLILHNNIFVNNKPIKISSYLLKSGDLITINHKYLKLIKTNIYKSNIWPIPPKHLIINYKTLQIIFGTFKNTNLSTYFSYHLNLEQILENYNQY